MFKVACQAPIVFSVSTEYGIQYTFLSTSFDGIFLFGKIEQNFFKNILKKKR